MDGVKPFSRPVLAELYFQSGGVPSWWCNQRPNYDQRLMDTRSPSLLLQPNDHHDTGPNHKQTFSIQATDANKPEDRQMYTVTGTRQALPIWWASTDARPRVLILYVCFQKLHRLFFLNIQRSFKLIFFLPISWRKFLRVWFPFFSLGSLFRYVGEF